MRNIDPFTEDYNTAFSKINYLNEEYVEKKDDKENAVAKILANKEKTKKQTSDKSVVDLIKNNKSR